jgi:glycine oxidase
MGHVAAVRPILADSFPVVGRHPEWKQLYILGGMGSKGVLHAPSAVKLLLDGIPSGHPWTVNRFV